jgi:hypothetical protein
MMTALVSASLAVLVACGGAKAKPATAASDSTTDEGVQAADAGTTSEGPSDERASEVAVALQGNEEGAHALLKQFVAPNADHAALTRSLRPTSADYKSLFDEKLAEKVEAALAKDWDSGKAVIKPKDNQTEIKVWGATGAELAQGTGNAKEFPAGYKKVAKHLAADVMFFRFKFVEAGKETGTAYDGLAFVNGHWVIAPKPWKALEGGKGGGVDGDDEDAQAAQKTSGTAGTGGEKRGGTGGGKGGGKKRGGKGGKKKK